MRLAPADAVRVVGPDGGYAHMLAVSERAAAGVWHQVPEAAGLHIEPLNERTGTSIIRVYSIN